MLSGLQDQKQKLSNLITDSNSTNIELELSKKQLSTKINNILNLNFKTTNSCAILEEFMITMIDIYSAAYLSEQQKATYYKFILNKKNKEKDQGSLPSQFYEDLTKAYQATLIFIQGQESLKQHQYDKAEELFDEAEALYHSPLYLPMIVKVVCDKATTVHCNILTTHARVIADNWLLNDVYFQAVLALYEKLIVSANEQLLLGNYAEALGNYNVAITEIVKKLITYKEYELHEKNIYTTFAHSVIETFKIKLTQTQTTPLTQKESQKLSVVANRILSCSAKVIEDRLLPSLIKSEKQTSKNNSENEILQLCELNYRSRKYLAEIQKMLVNLEQPNPTETNKLQASQKLMLAQESYLKKDFQKTISLLKEADELYPLPLYKQMQERTQPLEKKQTQEEDELSTQKENQLADLLEQITIEKNRIDAETACRKKQSTNHASNEDKSPLEQKVTDCLSINFSKPGYHSPHDFQYYASTLMEIYETTVLSDDEVKEFYKRLLKKLATDSLDTKTEISNEPLILTTLQSLENLIIELIDREEKIPSQPILNLNQQKQSSITTNRKAPSYLLIGLRKSLSALTNTDGLIAENNLFEKIYDSFKERNYKKVDDLLKSTNSSSPFYKSIKNHLTSANINQFNIEIKNAINQAEKTFKEASYPKVNKLFQPIFLKIKNSKLTKKEDNVNAVIQSILTITASTTEESALKKAISLLEVTKLFLNDLLKPACEKSSFEEMLSHSQQQKLFQQLLYNVNTTLSKCNHESLLQEEKKADETRARKTQEKALALQKAAQEATIAAQKRVAQEAESAALAAQTLAAKKVEIAKLAAEKREKKLMELAKIAADKQAAHEAKLAKIAIAQQIAKEAEERVKKEIELAKIKDKEISTKTANIAKITETVILTEEKTSTYTPHFFSQLAQSKKLIQPVKLTTPKEIEIELAKYLAQQKSNTTALHNYLISIFNQKCLKENIEFADLLNALQQFFPHLSTGIQKYSTWLKQVINYANLFETKDLLTFIYIAMLISQTAAYDQQLTADNIRKQINAIGGFLICEYIFADQTTFLSHKIGQMIPNLLKNFSEFQMNIEKTSKVQDNDPKRMLQ